MIQFSGHAHLAYDQSVHALVGELSKMAATVDRLLDMLSQAISGAPVSASSAKDMDKEVNQLEYDVIGDLHSILTKYSPSLDETRFLISTVRIAAALESIGDVAKVNIKRHGYSWGAQQSLPEPFKTNTLEMLTLTRTMLTASMDNISLFNAERLTKVLEKDSQVDELYVGMMEQIKNTPATTPEMVERYNTLLILIKDIERAADNTFEVGRIAYFAHTGNKPRKKHIRSGNI